MRGMLVVILAIAALGAPADEQLPRFELVQAELFSAAGGQTNAWADFDNDGDLDEFVGFRGRPNRLYRQDRGVFADVAAASGIADTIDTRAAAWGDFDGDGDVDLYIGFAGGAPNKLYRNDDGRFSDVAHALGVDLTGITRQVSLVDYDNDGDLDLFVAFRDHPNHLFRNDGGRFTDVTASSGIGDTRKTVGAVWFDVDQDGDLDLFVANQDGDRNGLFLNDRGHFTDVASAWGVDGAPRASGFGGVGPSVADFDGDGFYDSSRRLHMRRIALLLASTLTWTAERYHAVSDDLSQPVDLSAGDKYIDVVRALAVRIANRTDPPRWNESSFFKRFAQGATH